MISVLLERGEDTERKGHMKMEAETGVTQLHTMNIEYCWEPPEAKQGQEGVFPRTFKGSMALRHLDFRLADSKDCERIRPVVLSHQLW